MTPPRGERRSTLTNMVGEDTFYERADKRDARVVAPNPNDFFPFIERIQPVVHDWSGWTDGEIRRSPHRRSSSWVTATSFASTTPPRCWTSSPTAGWPSCPARSTPR